MNAVKHQDMVEFDDIKHITDEGIEYWIARDLQFVLEYREWRNFEKVINKAKVACQQSGNIVTDHFVDVNKMVTIGSGGGREIDDLMLSRYACYLIVQNADARKKVVAQGQTYFAIQTRKQELAEEEFKNLSEEEKRLAIRSNVTSSNKQLFETAQKSEMCIRDRSSAVPKSLTLKSPDWTPTPDRSIFNGNVSALIGTK